MKKIIILWIILGLIAVNITNAGSIKEEYELSERCKKSADDWFQKEWGGQHISNDGKMTTMADYKCHYNKKLNKCFVLLITTIIPKDKKREIINTNVLFDINENKEYGSYTKMQNESGNGSVLDIITSIDVQCTTKGAWDLLVKPYMEE